MEFTESPLYTLDEDQAVGQGATPKRYQAPVPKPRRSLKVPQVSQLNEHDDVDGGDVIVPQGGWYINLWESNYQREERLEVNGYMSVGNLILKFVEKLSQSDISLCHVTIVQVLFLGAGFGHQSGISAFALTPFSLIS